MKVYIGILLINKYFSKVTTLKFPNDDSTPKDNSIPMDEKIIPVDVVGPKEFNYV